MDARTMSMPDQVIERVVLYFHALSDPTRLRILNALRQSERSVGELTEIAHCSQANVSKHLGVLSEAGIIARNARGASSLISVADPAIYELCKLVCDSLACDLEKDLAVHTAIKGFRSV